MRLDYWNHPLVVSPYRIKFRSRGPGLIAATYFLGLVVIGGILQYHAASLSMPWSRAYFAVITGIQTVVIGGLAMTATWKSMHGEVVNRTLDYQRTAAIGPWEILLGKLLGEPVQAYLMVLAGFPLMVWCWAADATTPLVLALVTVNLVTTAILCGAMGLVHPIEVDADKTPATQAGSGRWGLIIGIYFLAQFTFSTPFIATNPYVSSPLGLLTPALSIYSIVQGNPWMFGFHFFGMEAPYLLATPIAQTALALLILSTQARRLVSPLAPPLTKPRAYLCLLVLDLLVAGLLNSPLGAVGSLTRNVAAFGLVHLLGALSVLALVAPERECWMSWAWRFRGRQSKWKALWLGDRSHVDLAIVTTVLMGIAGAALLVVLPAAVFTPGGILQQAVPEVAEIILMSALLTASLASCYQVAVLRAGRGGRILFIALVLWFVFVPHIAGRLLEQPWLEAASVSAYYAHWLAFTPPLVSLAPLVGLYGVLLVLALVLEHRMLRAAIRVINGKLQAMGVVQERGRESVSLTV